MSFGAELIEELDRAAGIRPGTRLTSDAQTPRGAKARIRYITSSRTGASVETVARLARVSTHTVRTWLLGTVPVPASRARIDSVYQQFFRINEQARYETARRRAAKRLILAVAGDALRLTDVTGDFRYWKPSTSWWPRFIARWIHADSAGLDEDWSSIISSWDYPESWEPDLIEGIEIV